MAHSGTHPNNKNLDMTEKTLENKVKKEVQKIGGIALKFFSLSFTGLPDRIVLFPGGKIKFVEVKAPGKRPSPRQEFIIGWLQSLGFEVWVIDSDVKIQEFIKSCQNLTRQKPTI